VAAQETWSLGQIPLLTLVAGIGVLVCTAANLLERGTDSPPTIIYWIGLLIIGVPIFYRLLSEEPSYRERLGLVVLFGIALFCVKVAHDSPMFIFPDEFAHSFNTNQIVHHHELFRFNPLLPITPHYPGLEAVTSALMSLTGVSSFTAGTLVIGAARLMMMLGMFLLFARVSRSARIAGIGVATFAGSSNFLFWSAQFSYESLSLPLMIVALLTFVEWDSAEPKWRRSWGILLVLVLAAIVVTHHLTSYATIIIFTVLALLYRGLGVKRPNPWRFAVIAAAMVAFWLLVVAGPTKDYLWPVLKNAFEGAFNTASGEAAPRHLFNGGSTDVGVTPLLPRAVALLAIALLGLGMLYGLRTVWRRYRLQPLPLVLVLGSLGFFAALMLRFAPSAWETGNRAGGFFFIGLAFVVAHAIVHLLQARSRVRWRYLGLAGGLGVILLGGAISGWPWDAQLTPPLRASAEGHEIVSEPVALAEWVQRELPGERMGAPEADARLLVAPGEAIAFAGESPDIKDIVRTPTLASWELPLLKEERIKYVVGDRRDASEDNVRGYFFHVPGEGNEALTEKGVIGKFSRLPVARLFDSGRIVLFDLENKP
jgi:hypothetical protein